MKVTREKYSQFINKLIPALVISYFIQAFLYLKYAPVAISQDVVVLLGLALAGVFTYHALFERYHTVTLHANYLEVQFAPLQVFQCHSYREITSVVVENRIRAYQHVMISLEDGSKLKLAYVDDAEKIRSFLLERN